MANPGKPAEVKRKLGAKGYKGSAPADVILLPAVSAIPEPLKPLGESGLSLWDRTWESWVWLR
jgi:hypothetical protein